MVAELEGRSTLRRLVECGSLLPLSKSPRQKKKAIEIDAAQREEAGAEGIAATCTLRQSENCK
jgi:hypothetical protein